VLLVDEKNAIRFHVEVAGTVLQIKCRFLLAVLHQQANRPQVGLKHSGVGCEDELFALGVNGFFQPDEILERVPIVAFPE